MTYSFTKKTGSGLQWIGYGLKLRSCTGQVNHSNFARKAEKKKAKTQVTKNAPMKPSHVCTARNNQRAIERQGTKAKRVSLAV